MKKILSRYFMIVMLTASVQAKVVSWGKQGSWGKQDAAESLVVQATSEGKVYGLFSYGLGDSPANAKNGYLSLMPYGCDENHCYVPRFTKDSLISSIADSQSYVEDLANIYKESLETKNFVAIGHSRGAEMLIHFVSSYNPANLKALVLIAPPVSVGAVVKSKIFGDPVDVPKKTINSIEKIKNKQLPIILLHQKNDALVRLAHSQCLLKAFKACGFKNVSLVIMQSGGHNDILDNVGSEKLQQFYKEINLF